MAFGSAYAAVVIGASAGALDALNTILPKLPKDYPLPIMVTVHLPPDKDSMLPTLLRPKCAVDVKEAEDKEPICAATVYFAPPDYHLLVEADKYLSLSNEEPVLFSRPSIDALFESAAEAYGPGLIGVVLTGANSDGANGLRSIAEAGGTAVIQRVEGAYAREMPRAALEACPSGLTLTLEQIAEFLHKAGSL